jgi:hypothetical protein
MLVGLQYFVSHISEVFQDLGTHTKGMNNVSKHFRSLQMTRPVITACRRLWPPSAAAQLGKQGKSDTTI